jgi:hypothetical protein
MEKMEEYRQVRHQAIKSIREEEHAQRKVSGSIPPEPAKTPGEQMRREELDSMINQIKQQYGTD